MLDWLQMRGRRPAKALPALDLAIEPDFVNGSFVFPNPWLRAIGRRPGDGVKVCSLTFGISPLNDRIYVDGVEVEEARRRMGYGSALLLAVARANAVDGSPLPITALCELWASNDFWTALRASKVPGLTVTRDLRPAEMDAETARWRTATRLSASQ